MNKVFNRINFNDNRIRRLTLLINTAFPGLSKIVILFIVRIKFGDFVTGQFVNDLFIIFIIGLFTSVNWSANIIMINPDFSKSDANHLLNKALSYSSVTLVIGTLVLFVLYELSILQNFIGSVVYLFGWSYYTLIRTFYLNRSLYIKLLFLDIFTLCVTASFLYVSYNSLTCVLSVQGIGCLVLSFLAWQFDIKALRQLTFKFWGIDKLYINKSWNLALVNFSNMGADLVIAPLAFQLLTPTYSTFIGFLNNFSAFFALFPKAISSHFVPLLVKSNLDGDLAVNYYKFEKLVYLTLVLSFLSFITIYFFISHTHILSSYWSLKFIIIIAILYVINFFVGQMILPISNLLSVINLEKHLIFANIFYFITYCGFVGLAFLCFNEKLISFIVILLGQILCSFIRWAYFKKRLNNYFI